MNKIKFLIKKTFLFNIYKYLRFLYRRFLMIFCNRAMILLYHRVSETENDPLLLSVNPNNFRAQMKYLKDNFNIISLSELVFKVKNKKSIKNSVVITFDDGYADNYYEALPILKELKIPATIFVTSGKINDNSPFYWDGNISAEFRGRSLTIEELKNISKEENIEIGAHTINHPHLASLKKEDQYLEIVKGKKILEGYLNKKIKNFTYPFGTVTDFNEDTIEILKNNEFECACANFNGLISRKTDLYILPRFLVRNWSVSEFKINL